MAVGRIDVSGPAGLSDEQLTEVARHLRRGGLLAYPTETVYGFGGLADPAPIRRLTRLKGGREGKSFLVLIEGPASVPELEWTPAARRLARELWPGPVTLVLRDPRERFAPGVRSDQGTVAVRVSPHAVPAAIVRRLDAPLTSTSANRPGGAPARTADEALDAAAGAPGHTRILVLDAGPLRGGLPSTLVDVTGERPEVLRTGAVSVERLQQVMSEVHEPTG